MKGDRVELPKPSDEAIFSVELCCNSQTRLANVGECI